MGFWNTVWLFVAEATPTPVVSKVRVEVRFVLSVVAMTRARLLPQKGLLGRNLITLFQCVNSFTKKKEAPLKARPDPVDRCRRRPRATRKRCPQLQCRALFENTAINALSILHSIASHRQTTLRRAAPCSARKACCRLNVEASSSFPSSPISRRTSRIAQNCARFSRHWRVDLRRLRAARERCQRGHARNTQGQSMDEKPLL